jgi:GNAT superfamily N-acetyltransferase
VSRTYVAAVGATVRGFYSLAMSGIRRDNPPPEHASRFPNFPLPVARLARLAVDQRHQRRGLGELLRADALQRCLQLSLEIGMVGVIVDARGERASGRAGERASGRADGTNVMSSNGYRTRR